ncbi:MAG: hypothetical protein MHM6MM_004740 [Cercozoa sp. M6MM]
MPTINPAVSPTHLFPPNDVQQSMLSNAIAIALKEDFAKLGDLTSLALIEESQRATADLIAKADGVVAGNDVFEAVFAQVSADCCVEWHVREGDTISTGQTLARVRGPTRAILSAERVALNFLQRASGIATATHAMVQRMRHGSDTCALLDTRKTVPTLRALDKAAVRAGGGANHRFGLYDMMMIKDNHIDAAGGISSAIEKAAAFLKSSALPVNIEVETRTLDEVREACRHKESVQRVMLDNMSPATMREAVAVVRADAPDMEIEASGNISLSTVAEVAATGVDCISSGALTHSVVALDVSLKNLTPVIE